MPSADPDTGVPPTPAQRALHLPSVLAWLLSVGACLLFTPPPVTRAAGAPSPPADIEVFSSPRCPHCRAASHFLDQLQRERPELTIVTHDVDGDPEALERLRALSARFGYRTVGVPTFHLRGTLIVGFGGPETTGERVRSLLAPRAPPENTCLPGEADPCLQNGRGASAAQEEVQTTLLGRLDARAIGLTLFTLALGLLDGFNPCAMWVLLFLLSILVNLRDRTRMAIIAGTFVLVSGGIYFAFMAAWLNIFLVIGFSRLIQGLLGVLALVIGLINLKDFAPLGAGPSLRIPDSAKPGLYARVRRIMQAENMVGALAGVVLLAALVNSVELLCTAGFPAVYTHILASRELPWWSYYGYLGLYNLAYIVDDAVMVTIAVVTLQHRKLQERAGRWLKLVSGLVMLGLGAVLLAKPEWLAAWGGTS